MSTVRTKSGAAGAAAVEIELAALRDENAMLFAQLHDVQEALERGHHLAARSADAGARLVMPDSRFPEVATEALRYRKALEARDDIHRLLGRQSFASRLGTAMVQGISGPGAALRLPGKLWSIWRDVKAYPPSRKLGGKGCQALISAYREGGDGAVGAMLKRSPASVQAEALTALARHLSNDDPAAAARYARQAYELDPRPFRLKWLAFREHEAGRPERAEAMLEALPPDTPFSESEQRQVEQLRAEAEQARRREVEEKYDSASRSRLFDQRMREIERECGEQQALAASRARQLDAARQAHDEVEQARAALALELARQGTRMLDVTQERDALHRRHEELARRHEDVLRTHDALLKMHEGVALARDELARRQEGAARVSEELTLAVGHKEQEVIEQRRQVEQLQWLRVQWERERLNLIERENASKREIEALSRWREAHGERLSSLDEQLGAMLTRQHALMEECIRRFDASGGQLELQLQTVIKDEVSNASRQLQALVGLLGYYHNGELPIVNPERNTWPVSPDFAVYLVQLLELRHYDVIIEFGAGLSTVVIAKALARQAAPRRGKSVARTKFVSFEHQEAFHAQTLAQLRAAGVDGMVDLLLAPLSAWSNARKESYPYYDYGAVLKGLAASMRGRSLSLLVVVDGPPAKVGKLARYPAGPIIRQLFPRAAIDFVLDDYVRDDEQEIAARWQTELVAGGYVCEVTERQLEKGACLIRARPGSEQP